MVIHSSGSRWLVNRQHNPQSTIRLFCFSPAGSGASFFRSWAAQMPDTVELWSVQLPGRESRLREPLITDWAELIQELVPVLRSHCRNPFALLGHSFGAILGFEVAHQLASQLGRSPEFLMVSGRQPPHIPCGKKLSSQPNQALIEDLQQHGATPQAVLESADLMALLLPIYRADLKLNETYIMPQARQPLDCPLFAWGGQADPVVQPTELSEWAGYTAQQFERIIFPGRHMYLVQEQEQAFLQKLRSLLSSK